MFRDQIYKFEYTLKYLQLSKKEIENINKAISILDKLITDFINDSHETIFSDYFYIEKIIKKFL